MIRDHVYFGAINAAQTRSLWVSDGTAAGTREVLVGNAGPSGLAPYGFAAVGGRVLFGGFGGSARPSLYALDGATSGVRALRPAGADAGGLSPSYMTAYGGAAYFGARNASGTTTLWRSDGTDAGTVEVPVAGLRAPDLYPAGFTPLGGKLAFNGSGGSFGNLFVSDGTAAGTAVVPVSGAPFLGLNIQGMASLGDRIVFGGNGPDFRQVLWVSDGTTAGTTVLDVPALNPTGSYSADPAGMTAFGNLVAFTAGDAFGDSRIWVTDGTAAGTRALLGLTGSSYGTAMAALPDGRLAFVASDASGVSGVYLTDGSDANTTALVVPGASAAGLQPGHLMALGDSLVFDGVAASGARALFVSDGTAAGTAVLASGLALTSSTSQIAAVLPGSTVRGTVRDDVLVDGPADQAFIGYNGRDVLALGEGRRGSTVTLLANGDVAVVHAGQTDTARGIEAMRFLDGRMVFDAADPAAQVMRLYQAGLGRAPDQAGLNFWIGNLQSGVPLAELATGFLASPEFAERFGTGLGNEALVTSIYQNVLGRDPEPDGLAFWAGGLNRGEASRGQTLAGISESPENKAGTAAAVQAGIWDRSEAAQQVARLYGTALGRAPDQGGLAFWTQAIEAGTSTLEALAQSFVGSAEFAAAYGPLGDLAFVGRLYASTLGRPGDADGMEHWTGELDRGTSRARVAIGFSESPEHQARTASDVGGEAPGTYGIRLG